MQLKRVGIAVLALAAPYAAQAWDPYPSVANPPPEERAWQRATRPLFKQPAQPLYPAAPVYTAPAAAVVPPVQYAPAPVAAPIYAPAPAPVAVATPVVAPPPPVYTPPPAPVAYEVPYDVPPVPENTPTYLPSDSENLAYTSYNTPAASKPTRWTFGLESYYDYYEEPDVMKTNSGFGGFTAAVDYFPTASLYLGADIRAAYGAASYESESGDELQSIPEQEYEARLLVGHSDQQAGSGPIVYTGLGTRYYRMKLRDEGPQPGPRGYDRRIFQLYVPVGVKAANRMGDWNINSMLEGDVLLYGNVSSRLGTIPGYENAENEQSFASGAGLRGELMFGQDMGSGAYEFGPLFRYWYVGDSEDDSQPAGTFIEPKNHRLQVGGALRYKF